MMKKSMYLTAAVVAACVLAGCKSTGMKLDAHLTSDGATQIIRRWKGMDVGVESQPGWLKDMVVGKQTSFKKAYADEIGTDEILPIVVVHAPTVDSAEALAYASVDYSFARDLSTRVNGLVGQNLDDGQKDAVLQSASMTQADFTGVHEIASFWQEVTTEGKKKLFTKTQSSTEVIYYYVCGINQKAYDTLTKVYLLQIVQDKNLDDTTKKTVLGLKNELVAKDTEKSADQRRREEAAHVEELENLRTKQTTAKADAVKTVANNATAVNVDDALAAAAATLGVTE